MNPPESEWLSRLRASNLLVGVAKVHPKCDKPVMNSTLDVLFLHPLVPTIEFSSWRTPSRLVGGAGHGARGDSGRADSTSGADSARRGREQRVPFGRRRAARPRGGYPGDPVCIGGRVARPGRRVAAGRGTRGRRSHAQRRDRGDREGEASSAGHRGRGDRHGSGPRVGTRGCAGRCTRHHRAERPLGESRSDRASCRSRGSDASASPARLRAGRARSRRATCRRERGSDTPLDA